MRENLEIIFINRVFSLRDCDNIGEIPQFLGVLFCERCLSELNEWIDVGTTGEVHTFTLLYENYDGSSRETPELVAFIQFGDGGLVHKLGEVEPEEVEIGMVVEAVFKEAASREGAITDILYFAPKE